MVIITLFIIVGNILLYFREVGATPLGCVNAQANGDPEYECVIDDKRQYSSATEKVNDVNLEQCPAYLPTRCQNQSHIDGVDLEQCPAYMPTTCQYQSPVDADTEGQYDDVL